MNMANREVVDLVLVDYATKAPFLNLDFANVSSTEMTAVSYTHLDVYKRQDQTMRDKVLQPVYQTHAGRYNPVPVSYTHLRESGCSTHGGSRTFLWNTAVFSRYFLTYTNTLGKTSTAKPPPILTVPGSMKCSNKTATSWRAAWNRCV